MEDFNSKYTGEQVEALLDIVSQGGTGGGGGEGEVQKTTEAEITAMGFTKNLGTITEVKMNGASKGTSGVVDLGTVITEHQDISGKQDKITDLDAIRSGAEKGATALQSVPSEYVTDTELMWTQVDGEAGVRLKGTNGTATGNFAISAGDDKTASDGTPFASAASGDHAVAFGYGNTCAGRTTLAQGLYNIVNGKDSVAFGQRNLVNGDQAFAAGQQNEVTTRLGVAIGYKNKATNTDSVAIGYQNTSSGSASVAMGDTCEANGTSSTAMGYKTKATGAYSSTFGENTQATNEGEVAMGLYNKSTTSTDASEQTAFSFGIGTSDTNRTNAFEIKKNGDVYIGDKMLSDFATTTELSSKVDKISGKQLSTEDFTSVLKTKLEGLSNYDDTELSEALSTLRGDFDALVSGDTTTAIKTFNEVIAFLDGIQDSQDLSSIIASIEQQIAGKMDNVTLAKVATSGSYNDLSNKPTIPSAVTESTVSGWGFTKNTGTYSKPSGGIPKTDLASAVQTSLGKADTALQSHQDISGKQDKLVSGTNIKTINGESILGEGDLTIKERELEKYATDKSWSIVASSLLELEVEHGKAPDGTKAIVVAEANSLYGVNLFDALMGNVDGVIDVFTNPNAFTLEISAIDTNVEIPVSMTSDVRVEVPFNNTIYIDMEADMASIYEISVQVGYVESVWRNGYWHGSSRMIGNKMPLSRFDNLDDNAYAGLMSIAPALIVDFVGTKTITEYVKNGDNWEVWSEGESGLNTKLNEWLEQIAQLLPTKTSQLENDSNFITSDGLKTINGESIVGSGDIEISGGSGGGEDIRYFTEFTVEDFIEACENNNVITYDTAELFNAMKSNKVICVPYRGYDKGFIVASYKSGENVEYPDMYLQKGDVEYYAWTGDSHKLVGEYPTFNSIQCVEIAGGEVFLEILDNYIYRITDPVDYLVPIPSDMQKGTTIHFMSGEFGTTIEMYNVGWANGEIPQIEPNTQYELSLMTNSTYTFNAVLIPFKEVE